MTDVVDPRRVAAAETLFGAILDAKRTAGDGAVCDALDRVGASAGQHQYRSAAAAIRGLPPGRPSIDDEWALRRILKFPPKRRREAVGIVAPQAAGAGASSKTVKATGRRLRKKLAKIEMDEMVLVAAPSIVGMEP